MTINLIAVVILLGGWGCARLFARLGLPNVLGMVFFGIICSLTIKGQVPQLLWDAAPFLKSLALIVILLRAGLGIRRDNLQAAGRVSLLLAFVPCLFEGAALTVMFAWLWNFSWPVAGLTAFMLSAVSLAVTVPAMLELRHNPAAMKNCAPTAILAGCSVDNVVAITLFSAFLGMATSKDSAIGEALLKVPLSIAAGIICGALVGLLLVRWLDKKYERIRATEKTLILICVAFLLAEFGNMLQIAALLGVMTVGFVFLQKSERIAHEIAAKLSKIWVFAEIILFVLIGLSLEVSAVSQAGLQGLVIIAVGLIFRSLGVLLATAGSSLSRADRRLSVMAYLPKATTQAALGGVALQHGLPEGQLILAVAVMAIVVTSPIGLLGIKYANRAFAD
ncbi:MAG TPA: cation:proton antiporter [Candidatus Rifleibacterium sp.]|nr:cation:proton antiporter [Candidatus Rifleibacterium sp.]